MNFQDGVAPSCSGQLPAALGGFPLITSENIPKIKYIKIKNVNMVNTVQESTFLYVIKVKQIQDNHVIPRQGTPGFFTYHLSFWGLSMHLIGANPQINASYMHALNLFSCLHKGNFQSDFTI